MFKTFQILAFAASLTLSSGAALARASDGYPPEALRLELEGVTNFRALIGTDGRAKKCEITESSGHEILDTATCTKVIDHGRFEPARDDKGRKVQDWYSGRINWQIN